MGSLHLKFMDAATSLVITKVLTLDNFCSSLKVTENLHHAHTHMDFFQYLWMFQ
jgi:hypothetical protein